MEQTLRERQIPEAEQERLRRRIEWKRRKLDSKIRGRADLLEHQELSRELDRLIGQYLELRVGTSSKG